MDPVTLSLLVNGLQAGAGFVQRQSAKSRRNKALRDLKYEVPSATKEQVGLLRQRASRNELPGADITRSRIESDLSGALTGAERAAQTSMDVLGAYRDMFGRKSDINKQLLESGAQYKSQNELELAKGLGLMAEAEGQEFYYNKFVPFLSEMGFAGDEAQGGAANIASGFQGAYNTWENQWMMDAYKEIYNPDGTGGGATTPGVDFTGMRLNNASESVMAKTPNNVPGLSPNRTTLKPFESPPQWQVDNPINYPYDWIKYYNK